MYVLEQGHKYLKLNHHDCKHLLLCRYFFVMQIPSIPFLLFLVLGVGGFLGGDGCAVFLDELDVGDGNAVVGKRGFHLGLKCF